MPDIQLGLGWTPPELDGFDSDFTRSDFEEVAEVSTPYLSPSSISTLLSCPEKFRQEYVIRKPRKPGAWAVGGRVFHEARHRILEMRARGADPNIPQIHAIAFQKECATAYEQGLRMTTTEVEGQRASSWAMLNVYEQKIAPTIQGIVAVERGARLHVPGVPMVVYGRIDVETEGEVIDTKTGKQSSRSPDPRWSVQGLIYSAMKQKDMVWHSIGYTAKGNVTFQTPASSAELRRAWRPSITERANLLAETAYEQLLHFNRTRGAERPWPGSGMATGACRFCDHKAGCPFYVA